MNECMNEDEWTEWSTHYNFHKQGMVLFLWKEALMLKALFVKGNNKPWGSWWLKTVVKA